MTANPEEKQTRFPLLSFVAIPSAHLLLCTVANRNALVQIPIMNPTLATEINRLSSAEKILLVEEIWDQVAESTESVPVPEWHRAELDRRLADDANDPGRPWDEIRDELFRR